MVYRFKNAIERGRYVIAAVMVVIGILALVSIVILGLVDVLNLSISVLKFMIPFLKPSSILKKLPKAISLLQVFMERMVLSTE